MGFGLGQVYGLEGLVFVDLVLLKILDLVLSFGLVLGLEGPGRVI